MRSKELSVELRDRIVSKHRSGEGYQNISAALKVSKNTVTSIILKWKQFGTTKTLPKARHPAKLSTRGEKGLGLGGDQEPDGHSDKAPDSSVVMGEPSRRTSISAALHQSGLYCRVARRKPLLRKGT